MSETQSRKEAKSRKGRSESFFEARARITRSGDNGCGDEAIERLAFEVIGAAIEVHRVLGPGLPELVYERALSHELSLREVPHECQASVPVDYKGIRLGEGTMDLLVDTRLVVELKAAESLLPVHAAQLRAYLCAKHLPLGLLINFNAAVLHDGIRRVINSSS